VTPSMRQPAGPLQRAKRLRWPQMQPEFEQ
jgi:5-methylcytosine-specific restriction endonuclease McrA